MKAQTKETQAAMTPEKSIQSLKEGNIRFQKNSGAKRNLLEQVRDTTKGQFPFATILSCIDSRIPAEMVFDQGIGDLFSVRIAGNFINNDILGSMEFACKLAGSKVLVVMGHTSCGAVKGACDGAELGNLTGMLDKIKPAVNAVLNPTDTSQRTSANLDFVNEVANKNVDFSIEGIRSGSDVLAEMERNGEIDIVGAMYDVATGKVTFH
jgi:carbonic anhydrase